MKKFQFHFLTFALVLVSVAACRYSPEADELTFEDAWVRALPTGSGMTAAFGTLSNPGSDAVEIVGFTSPEFGDVSLHRTEVEDGMSTMREVKTFRIDPGSRLVLEPGGYHLMLMMPAADVQPGQSVVLVMKLADGRTLSFQVPVEKR
jgi:copper(I)-binding protein